MSNRYRRGGFSKTHQTCPCTKHEQKCFSVFADNPSAGYCFACSQVVTGHNSAVRFSNRNAHQDVFNHQLFLPQETVSLSTWSANNIANLFGNIEGHLEAFREYAQLRVEGRTHLDAYQLSGYQAIFLSRLPEIRGEIHGLPSFFQQLIAVTGVSEVLTVFNVGVSTYGEVLYWIIDEHGRVCNAQATQYDGLRRSRHGHTRYLYRGSDGYRVTALFGSEQLVRGKLSWIQQPFENLAPAILVESPKSALLATVLYPAVIWLASCGVSGVTPIKARALRGREVYILFDNDRAGHVGARRAQRVLLEAGAFTQIIDPEVFFGGSRPEGWDVGDEAISMLRGSHDLAS